MRVCVIETSAVNNGVVDATESHNSRTTIITIPRSILYRERWSSPLYLQAARKYYQAFICWARPLRDPSSMLEFQVYHHTKVFDGQLGSDDEVPDSKEDIISLT